MRDEREREKRREEICCKIGNGGRNVNVTLSEEAKKKITPSPLPHPSFSPNK